MKIQVLGSGTLVPNAHRGSPSHWVEVGSSNLLLDCGTGTLRTLSRLGLPWEKVSHVLITHFHLDHVSELAPLLFALKNGLPAPRREKMTLLGPTGLGHHLESLAATHGGFVLDPGFPLAIRELEPGDSWEHRQGEFRVQTLGTNHSEHSLALRIESHDGTLGYTGDTGPDPNLGSFFRGCQVLLAECSYPDGYGMGTHLTPGGLADLARMASPNILVTVHCYPPLDPHQVPRLLREGGYEGRALAGFDGLSLDLTGGEIELGRARIPQ